MSNMKPFAQFGTMNTKMPFHTNSSLDSFPYECNHNSEYLIIFLIAQPIMSIRRETLLDRTDLKDDASDYLSFMSVPTVFLHPNLDEV